MQTATRGELAAAEERAADRMAGHQAAIDTVGGLGAALAGGKAGAETGAVIGLFFGPGPVTAIGPGIGGLLGAVAGGYAGNQAGAYVYDDLVTPKGSLTGQTY